jgi:aspartate/methionine/tyrosine aminotransferase
VWVKVPVPNHDAFFARLLEHGILVSPGASFGDGGQGYFRIALVPSLPQIEQAIAVWEKIRP